MRVNMTQLVGSSENLEKSGVGGKDYALARHWNPSGRRVSSKNGKGRKNMILGTKTGERGRETGFAENGKYLNAGYQTC